MNKNQYAVYLASPEWKALRDKKRAEQPRKTCAGCCRHRPLQLHHMIYRGQPEQTEIRDLIWLCGDCHKLFHELHGLLVPAEIRKYGISFIKKYSQRVLRAAARKAGYFAHKTPVSEKRGWLDEVIERKIGNERSEMTP